MGNTSEGAKQAWVTMRKNAAEKKRKNRNRALRAWVTIRANRAAKKAAAKRRAQAKWRKDVKAIQDAAAARKKKKLG